MGVFTKVYALLCCDTKVNIQETSPVKCTEKQYVSLNLQMS